ncbi:microtubule-associated protein Jupiter isoform X3 [Nylanderia fulva]|uniref:microtubule-associated protein Jupiter isoform X3 n=1 Tax=Nylanderia fulva TaxID=613905 RepID=UPI0010FB421B|nr:microtubule-associated protein Jupiter isoform X3 [Nylanderia fulva]
MATYATYRHVELDNVGYGKKRVLKPPGGGSSDIFGAGPEEMTSPRRVKIHNQSQLGSALFGNANGTDNPHTILSPRSNKPAIRRKKRFRGLPTRNPVTGDGIEVTPARCNPRKCRDGNPVTGAGYASEMQKNGKPAVQNGIASSNSSSSGEKSNGTSSPGTAKLRTRIPPGGYSSGLW